MALTEMQLSKLSDDEREEYNGLEGDDRDSFEYFFGFAHGSTEQHIITNEEIQMYQEHTDLIDLKTVWQLCGNVPHKGQQPMVYAFDRQRDIFNNFVIAAGRRFGKSYSLSHIGVRELLVPYSATVLICPTFANAKIIFNEVLKLVNKLELPIKQMNRGQFNFELVNGSRFTANSSSNIESALGGHFSLLLFEEFQSIANADIIYKQMLAPTLLDYGTRPSGILYGRAMFIGTSRGVDNQLYDYFIKELDIPNWKSFTAPSMSNPTLPANYFEQMRLELGDMLYNQEILAKFLGMDDNVFHAFDKEVNLYDPDTITFNKDSLIVSGIDIGWSDSTAQLWIYREIDTYYIHAAYSENTRATKQHVQSYREIEDSLIGEIDMRYGDPAAAQTLNDYILTYNYDVSKADNSVADSIKYINQLFSPTGVNERPKLYVSQELTELIRQLTRVRYKRDQGKTAKDPFIKDTNGTHWDLIAALRYALYSDKFNMATINIMQG